MEKTVMIIYIGKRKETALNVQKVLTGYGEIIKTRLGIHDGVGSQTPDTGLIFLELVGPDSKKDELLRKISLLEDVNAKMVKIGLAETPKE